MKSQGRGLERPYLLMGDSYEDEERVDEAIAYWEKLPFEAPDSPEIVCKSVENTVEECMMQRGNYLEEFQIIPRNPVKVYPYNKVTGCLCV